MQRQLLCLTFYADRSIKFTVPVQQRSRGSSVRFIFHPHLRERRMHRLHAHRNNEEPNVRGWRYTFQHHLPQSRGVMHTPTVRHESRHPFPVANELHRSQSRTNNYIRDCGSREVPGRTIRLGGYDTRAVRGKRNGRKSHGRCASERPARARGEEREREIYV